MAPFTTSQLHAAASSECGEFSVSIPASRINFGGSIVSTISATSPGRNFPEDTPWLSPMSAWRTSSSLGRGYDRGAGISNHAPPIYYGASCRMHMWQLNSESHWELRVGSDHFLGFSTATSRRRENFMNCPHCHKRISASAIAKSIRAKGGGRQPILRPCAKCGKLFGARALRKHIPLCTQNALS
jgi:endogenous inhibitor of DNA gyrase (YacG/DUF329 family)